MSINITDAERFGFLVLLAIWAGMLFGGFVFGSENADHTHRMPTWTRMAASLILVIAGWSWWVVVRQSNFSPLALFLAIGMSLGFIGDLFMANLIPVSNYVLGGIGAFGLGHIAYITGLVSFGNQSGLDNTSTRWAALIIWLVIAALAWYIVVYRGKVHTILHIAALPYSLLLAGTVGLASGLALQAPEFLLLAVGAALFLASDLLLATQLFNKTHFRLIGDVVWLTYSPGQMLIVFAIALTAIF